MFQATPNWQPTASLENLRQRAVLLAKVRDFFAARGILEVETPLLSAATVTDLHLHSMQTEFAFWGSDQAQTLYLQTSPEFAMKRLLAAGSGPIYQICKAFRNGEAGKQHNPEFTMLEWYRPGFDLADLMTETDELLQYVLKTQPAVRLSYANAFLQRFHINPHTASLAELQDCATTAGLKQVANIASDKDACLDLLLSHFIEPELGKQQPTFLYDFPASQAALAKLKPGNPPVAERFEVYINGVELANGYNELVDASEQQRRFEKDLLKRQQLGYPQVQMDRRLVAALSHGMPECAGIALGIDRLVMLALAAETIDQVIGFPLARA